MVPWPLMIEVDLEKRPHRTLEVFRLPCGYGCISDLSDLYFHSLPAPASTGCAMSLPFSSEVSRPGLRNEYKTLLSRQYKERSPPSASARNPDARVRELCITRSHI